MLRDMLWQLYLPLTAACSNRSFCLISQAVLKTAFSGLDKISLGSCWTLPKFFSKLSLTSEFHLFFDKRIFRNCLFTTTCSPASVPRVKIIALYGSMDSEFPAICAVDAVGMSAVLKEFRRPCIFMFCLRTSHVLVIFGVALLLGLVGRVDGVPTGLELVGGAPGGGGRSNRRLRLVTSRGPPYRSRRLRLVTKFLVRIN
jgi:hypothetical protein